MKFYRFVYPLNKDKHSIFILSFVEAHSQGTGIKIKKTSDRKYKLPIKKMPGMDFINSIKLLRDGILFNNILKCFEHEKFAVAI